MSVPLPSHESPVHRVLDRLERVKKSQNGWTARCPAHDDRWPSLKVDEGRDGRVLLHDHGGCTANEIVSSIGLEMSDLFPPSERPFIPSPRPKPQPLPRSVAEVLLEAAQLPEAWEIAKTLAPLEPAQARRDVVESWDFVSDNGSAPAVMDLYALLRGIALFRYADPSRAHEPAERRRAVNRLVEELSR